MIHPGVYSEKKFDMYRPFLTPKRDFWESDIPVFGGVFRGNDDSTSDLWVGIHTLVLSRGLASVGSPAGILARPRYGPTYLTCRKARDNRIIDGHNSTYSKHRSASRVQP